MQDDFEKNSFEKDWQKAFENAELTPWRTSFETVMQEVEATKAEKKRKKALMFWRYSAAACFLLAIALYSSGWFNKLGDDNLVINKSKNSETNSTHKIGQSEVLAINKLDQGKAGTKNSKEEISSNRQKNHKVNIHIKSENNSQSDNEFISELKSNKAYKKKDGSESFSKWDNQVNNTGKNLLINKENGLASKDHNSKLKEENIHNSESELSNINFKNTFLSSINIIKNSSKEFIDKIISLPAKVNYLPLTGDEPEIEEKKKGNNRWNMDLAFAPGSYIPNIESHKATEYAASFQNAQSSKQHLALYSSSSPVARSSLNTTSLSIDNDLSNAKPAFSYQVNLGAGYAINSKVTINLGFQYLYQNSQINTSQYVADSYSNTKTTYFADIVSDSKAQKQIDNLNDFSITSSRSSISNNGITINNTYRYLSAPIIVQYKILNHRFGLSAGTGISADMLINNQIGNSKEGISEQTFNSDNSIYKNFAYSGILNLRLDYKLSKKYSFFLEPGFRTALSSFTKSSAINSYPSSFNVGTGLRFKF